MLLTKKAQIHQFCLGTDMASARYTAFRWKASAVSSRGRKKLQLAQYPWCFDNAGSLGETMQGEGNLGLFS